MALATGAAVSNEFALVAAFAREVGQRLAAVIAKRAPGIFDSYRPELHYMRGPGPKWRAKQGLAPPPAKGDGRARPLCRVVSGHQVMG